MVIDSDNGTLRERLPASRERMALPLRRKTGHGFATSGNDQSVVMFDLKTFKALGRIPAAEDADAIVYDPRRTASSP